MNQEPENCPGVGSSSAGKSEACEGCPNQSLCSSNEAVKMKEQFLSEAHEIAQVLQPIKKIIIVMSGKGGVGKSTMAANLARALVHYHSLNVGVLDLDLCGPSISCILGASGDIHQSGSGYCPILNEDGIALMSTSFLLNSNTDAVIWRGPKKNALIKKLLLNVDWGDGLDVLIIDTPPGTSDEHITLSQYLQFLTNVSVVVVSTPQEMSLQDVRKELNFINRVHLTVACICVNMAYFSCSNCHNDIEMFPNSSKSLSNKYHCFTFPFDPLLAHYSDTGQNIFEVANLTPTSGCVIPQYKLLAQYFV